MSTQKVAIAALAAMVLYRRYNDGFELRFMSWPDWVEAGAIGFLAYTAFVK